jgi:hypothetical protein
MLSATRRHRTAGGIAEVARIEFGAACDIAEFLAA